MAEWSDKSIQAGMKQDTNQKWAHGLLKPIQVSYWRWKREGEDSASEITEAEFNALPSDGGRVIGGGEKVTFEIDVTALNPKLQFTVARGTFRGFADWKRIVAPSINEVTGLKPPASLIEFNKRSKAGNWWVEAEIIQIPSKKDPTSYNEVPKFIRMTQNEEECRAWAKERFGGKKPGEVPEDVIATAQMMFKRIAKGDRGVFATKLSGEGYEDLAVYKDQLIDMSAQWS